MKRHLIKVVRTEQYSKMVAVDCDDPAKAVRAIQDRLDVGGWDAVFGDDGDYIDCWSGVSVANSSDIDLDHCEAYGIQLFDQNR